MAVARTLDVEAVTDAGLGVLRRDGVDGLRLRPVAAALGVTPMALYRHVADAEELRERVLEAALASLPDVPAAGAWSDRYRSWAHGARHALLPYRGLAHHVLQHWTELPSVLRIVEQLLAAAPTGPAHDAVAASNAVFTHVLLRVDAEQALRAGVGLHRTLDRFADVELPLLRANAHEYATARVDEHFAYGLDALLAGVASARRQRAPTPGGSSRARARP